MKVTLLHFGILGLLAAPISALSAQDADESALDALDNQPKPLPQKIEPPGAVEFRDAMRRIAQRPNDGYALTDAGYAAIKLGDYDAAFNFFTKASTQLPSDTRVKTGLAIAQVRRENPFEALSLFDEASRLGANERTFAMDRGLAFDLLGNFDRAERDYTMAASMGPSDELTLRHSISLALSGRKDEADRMLIPLLQRENPEAWRARAMMLAARGDYKEANKIALGFLSESEARRMDGYFRNMSRLTVAQQAAAMHFGHFPLGSDIGEDSDQVRTMAAATGARPVPRQGDGRLVPSGPPLGTKTAVATKPEKPKKQPRKGKDSPIPVPPTASAATRAAVDAAATPKAVDRDAQPASAAVRPPVRIALPALAKPQPAPTPAALPAPVLTPAAVPASLPPATTPPVSAPVAAPVATPAPVIAPAATPVPTPAPVITPPPAAPVATASVTDTPKPVQGPVDSEVRITRVDPPLAEPAPMPAASGLPATAAATRIETLPDTQPKADVTPVGPGFESVEAPKVAAPQPEPAAVLPQPEPAVPVLASATPTSAMPDAMPQPVPTEIEQPQPTIAAAQTVEPAPQPAVEKTFDLGALVESIEVPEEEKKPSVAPVDLKKIKAATPKDEASTASVDANVKGAKPTANTPRIFVQIATGADMNGLGYDYRRAAKKNSALFASQSGWTAEWGKTRRLLVGPFADMKAAKKWEADYRKAGGEGFIWQSDRNAEITKLK
jgi:Flp pilus assembly protein TadD